MRIFKFGYVIKFLYLEVCTTTRFHVSDHISLNLVIEEKFENSKVVSLVTFLEIVLTYI